MNNIIIGMALFNLDFLPLLDTSRCATNAFPQHSHNIILTLGKPHHNANNVIASYNTSMFVLLDSTPELGDALAETLSLAPKWKIIGTFLGVKDPDINKIQMDEVAVDDRMRSMLATWLKQVRPPPTWKALIEAVRILDNPLAESIIEKLADTHTL